MYLFYAEFLVKMKLGRLQSSVLRANGVVSGFVSEGLGKKVSVCG